MTTEELRTAGEETSVDARPEKSPLFARLRSRRPKGGKGPARKRVLLALGAAAALAAAFGIYKLFFTKEEKIALTGTTTYGTLDEVIEGSGTTTPADSVTYDFSGTVLEWYVSAGDEVQAGDVLTDYDKLIDRQIERAAITQTAGFAKIFTDASKILTTKA